MLIINFIINVFTIKLLLVQKKKDEEEWKVL